MLFSIGPIGTKRDDFVKLDVLFQNMGLVLLIQGPHRMKSGNIVRKLQYCSVCTEVLSEA